MAASSDFSSLPDDVLSDRILTLLDRPTLGSLSLVSRRLHSLVLSSPTPWSIICSLTWPSTLSPLLLPVIPSFPDNPYLSFFLNSYPLLASSLDPSHFPSPYRPRRLISAVDVRHRGEVVFSGAVETDTFSAWFARSPFAIHVVGPGEVFHTPLPELPDANRVDELTLSWILVDPEGRRAANLSSHSVLDISRYFIGEVHGRFFCVLGGKEGTAMELVKFEIVVIFSEDEDGNVWVKRLSICAKDLEMKRLNGENTLEVLERGALGSTERRWKDMVRVASRRYDEFNNRSSKQLETMAGPRKVPRNFRIPRVGNQLPPGCRLARLPP